MSPRVNGTNGTQWDPWDNGTAAGLLCWRALLISSSVQSTKTPSAPPKLEISGSRQFTSWLREQRLSLAFSTYQTGKLFFIGLRADGRLSIFERTFERCMGLCASADAQTLWMSSLYQLWRFENALPFGEKAPGGYDRLYVPQLGYTTGDVDAHDIALGSAFRVVRDRAALRQYALFVYCCAERDAQFSASSGNRRFISKLAAEDRCHLNGLAMEGDQPRFVTAVSVSDVHEGWREHRRDGGVVIDVPSGAIVARRSLDAALATPA